MSEREREGETMHGGVMMLTPPVRADAPALI